MTYVTTSPSLNTFFVQHVRQSQMEPAEADAVDRFSSPQSKNVLNVNVLNIIVLCAATIENEKRH